MLAHLKIRFLQTVFFIWNVLKSFFLQKSWTWKSCLRREVLGSGGAYSLCKYLIINSTSLSCFHISYYHYRNLNCFWKSSYHKYKLFVSHHQINIIPQYSSYYHNVGQIKSIMQNWLLTRLLNSQKRAATRLQWMQFLSAAQREKLTEQFSVFGEKSQSLSIIHLLVPIFQQAAAKFVQIIKSPLPGVQFLCSQVWRRWSPRGFSSHLLWWLSMEWLRPTLHAWVTNYFQFVDSFVTTHTHEICRLFGL